MSHTPFRPFSATRTPLVGLAVAATVVAAAPACAPAAPASPESTIRAHLHRADIALPAVASGSANVDVSVRRVVVALDAASDLSARLAARARTGKAEREARASLELVAGVAARAEVPLDAAASTALHPDTDAIVQAYVEVTDAHRLVLTRLARLHGTTNVRADALLAAGAALKARASRLAGKVPLEAGGSAQGSVDSSSSADAASPESGSGSGSSAGASADAGISAGGDAGVSAGIDADALLSLGSGQAQD